MPYYINYPSMDVETYGLGEGPWHSFDAAVDNARALAPGSNEEVLYVVDESGRVLAVADRSGLLYTPKRWREKQVQEAKSKDVPTASDEQRIGEPKKNRMGSQEIRFKDKKSGSEHQVLNELPGANPKSGNTGGLKGAAIDAGFSPNNDSNRSLPDIHSESVTSTAAIAIVPAALGSDEKNKYDPLTPTKKKRKKIEERQRLLSSGENNIPLDDPSESRSINMSRHYISEEVQDHTGVSGDFMQSHNNMAGDLGQNSAQKNKGAQWEEVGESTSGSPDDGIQSSHNNMANDLGQNSAQKNKGGQWEEEGESTSVTADDGIQSNHGSNMAGDLGQNNAQKNKGGQWETQNGPPYGNMNEDWSLNNVAALIEGADFNIQQLFNEYARKADVLTMEDFSYVVDNYSETGITEGMWASLLANNQEFMFHEGSDHQGIFYVKELLNEMGPPRQSSGGEMNVGEAGMFPPDTEQQDQDEYSDAMGHQPGNDFDAGMQDPMQDTGMGTPGIPPAPQAPMGQGDPTGMTGMPSPMDNMAGAGGPMGTPAPPAQPAAPGQPAAPMAGMNATSDIQAILQSMMQVLPDMMQNMEGPGDLPTDAQGGEYDYNNPDSGFDDGAYEGGEEGYEDDMAGDEMAGECSYESVNRGGTISEMDSGKTSTPLPTAGDFGGGDNMSSSSGLPDDGEEEEEIEEGWIRETHESGFADGGEHAKANKNGIYTSDDTKNVGLRGEGNRDKTSKPFSNDTPEQMTYESTNGNGKDGITSEMGGMGDDLGQNDKQKNKGGSHETMSGGASTMKENVMRISHYAKQAINEFAKTLPEHGTYGLRFVVQCEGVKARQRQQLVEAVADIEELMQAYGTSVPRLDVHYYTPKKGVVKKQRIQFNSVRPRGPVVQEGKVIFRYPEVANDFADQVVTEGRACRTYNHNWGAAVAGKFNYGTAKKAFMAIPAING